LLEGLCVHKNDQQNCIVTQESLIIHFQSIAIDVLSDAVSFMANQTNENPELMQKVGDILLHGIGNLMSSSASEVAVTDDDKRGSGMVVNKTKVQSNECYGMVIEGVDCRMLIISLHYNRCFP